VRRPRLAGLAGATLAIGVAVAVVLFPAPLGESARELEPSSFESVAAAATPEPGPAGLVGRLDARLAARMPRLEEAARRLLARTIVAEAEATRIDPLLVLALIEIESSFDPSAQSNRGARGLMQLREATMRRELERWNLPEGDPHDPVANVRAGVRYLRRLLDAFGRQEVALMAYNAGPNRILGYLREGEIPERFHVYPRRVMAEHRRLRRSLAPPASETLADASPPARAPVAPQ
jgi:soluble lytic murein transglycosylase-like protein